MDFIILLLLAFAPGIFLLWYFYQKDRKEPEPVHLVLKMFLYGILLVIPAVILESLVGIFIPFNFLLTVVSAPIIEECLKFLVVKKAVYGRKEFSEPLDGIVYAAAVALGFASLENVFYLADPDSASRFFSVFVLRAVFTVPSHVLNSSMWGFALGVAKFSKKEKRNKLIEEGLIASIVAHGIFNFFTFIPEVAIIFFIIIAIVMWRLVHQNIEKLKQHRRARYSAPH